MDMNVFYRHFVSAEEKQRVQALEPFDEFEVMSNQAFGPGSDLGQVLGSVSSPPCRFAASWVLQPLSEPIDLPFSFFKLCLLGKHVEAETSETFLPTWPCH